MVVGPTGILVGASVDVWRPGVNTEVKRVVKTEPPEVKVVVPVMVDSL